MYEASLILPTNGPRFPPPGSLLEIGFKMGGISTLSLFVLKASLPVSPVVVLKVTALLSERSEEEAEPLEAPPSEVSTSSNLSTYARTIPRDIHSDEALCLTSDSGALQHIECSLSQYNQNAHKGDQMKKLLVPTARAKSGSSRTLQYIASQVHYGKA